MKCLKYKFEFTRIIALKIVFISKETESWASSKLVNKSQKRSGIQSIFMEFISIWVNPNLYCKAHKKFDLHFPKAFYDLKSGFQLNWNVFKVTRSQSPITNSRQETFLQVSQTTMCLQTCKKIQSKHFFLKSNYLCRITRQKCILLWKRLCMG